MFVALTSNSRSMSWWFSRLLSRVTDFMGHVSHDSNGSISLSIVSPSMCQSGVRVCVCVRVRVVSISDEVSGHGTDSIYTDMVLTPFIASP